MPPAAGIPVMNAVALIILFTLAAGYLLELAASLLNIRNIRHEVPVGFEDVYDPERYRKSQAYLKANTRLGQISETVHLAVFLIFWFGGGFARLDTWLRGFGWDPVATGVAFTAVLVALKMIVGLPFAVYAVFVIEERFGFNRMGWKTFVADRIKGLLLGAAVGLPLIAAVLAFFSYAGPDAWWYCWIAVTVVSVALQYIAPTMIMPLFNKFTPLEEGELKTAILTYARSVDYPVANLFVMDGSKRSAKGNAFFTGYGTKKRIALFDTLIRQHTTDELVAVLAHEIGHYKKKHILCGLLIGIVHAGIMLYLVSLFISYPVLFAAFYMPQMSVYAGLVFFALLFTPVNFFLGIVLQARSRRNEYAADRFAAITTGRPEAMISALKKLSANNLANLLPHPLYVLLHYSHPPVIARIAALRKISARR